MAITIKQRSTGKQYTTVGSMESIPAASSKITITQRSTGKQYTSRDSELITETGQSGTQKLREAAERAVSAGMLREAGTRGATAAARALPAPSVAETEQMVEESARLYDAAQKRVNDGARFGYGSKEQRDRVYEELSAAKDTLREQRRLHRELSGAEQAEQAQKAAEAEYLRLSRLDTAQAEKALEAARRQSAQSFDIDKMTRAAVTPGGLIGYLEATRKENDAVQGKINTLEADIEGAKRIRTGQDYMMNTLAPDFAQNSRYQTTARENGGFGDLDYDYINRDPAAIQAKRDAMFAGNGIVLDIPNGYVEQMSDEQIAMFNYLYHTKGKDTAYEYIKFLEPDLTAAQRRAETAEWQAEAEEHPVGMSAVSVLMAPTKGISYVGQAADYLKDGKIDQNAAYNRYSYLSSGVRQTVSELAEDNWGKKGSFLYQTGMSMGDFLMTTLVSGGFSNPGSQAAQKLALSIMGTGAAADTTIAAKDRGLSDNQAFALGTIAGAAEVITEKVSLDKLLDMTALGKSKMGYFLQNVLAEGSEEVGSDFINLFADVLVAKDKSEWQQSIDQYKAQGMDEKTAFWHAAADQAEQMGLDFLGGALSGGIMSGGGIVLNQAAGNRQNGRVFEGVEATESTGQDLPGGVRYSVKSGLKGIEPFSEIEAQNLTSHKGVVSGYGDTFRQFIDNVKQLGNTVRYYFGKVSDDLGTAIHNATGFNVSGYNIAIRSDEVVHTLSQHGDSAKEALRGHLPVTEDVLERLPEIFSEPDEIVPLKDKDYAGRDAFEIRKQIDGYMVAVVGIANGKHSIEVDTVYVINKKGKSPTTSSASQTTDPSQTSETSSGPTSINSIPQSAQKSKGIISDEARATFGAQGQQVVDTVVEETMRLTGMQAPQALGAFARVYQRGLNERNMGTEAGMSDAAVQIAYEAGRADASPAQAEGKAGNVPMYKETAGLIENEHTKRLPKKVREFLDKLAKRTGSRIEFTDELPENVNGKFDPKTGTLKISTTAKNPIIVVAAHEITHRMQQVAPRAYQTYREYVVRKVSERLGTYAVDEIMFRYKQDGIELTVEEAKDELAAEFTETLVMDGKLFPEMARENRTEAQGLLDALKHFIQKVKDLFRGNSAAQNSAAYAQYGVDMDTIETAAQLWEAAMAETETVAENAEENAVRGDGVERFSAKRIQNLTEQDVRGLLENALNGQYHDGTYIPLRRNTPESIIHWVEKRTKGEIKVENLPIVMNVGKARQAMGEDVDRGKNRQHGISIDGLVEIIKGMDEPSYIILQKNNRCAVVVKYYDGKKHHSWAVLDFGDFHHEPFMNGYEGGSFNVLVTTFEPENLNHYIANTAKKVLYDKTKDAPQSGSGSKLPSHLNGTPFADSIPNSDENSNGQNSLKTKSRTGDLVKAIEDIERNRGSKTEAEVQAEIQRAVEEYREQLIEDYGELPAGERPAREVHIPKKTSEREKVSQTVRTVLEAKATPDELLPDIERLVAEEQFSYESYGDEQAIRDAEETIRDKSTARAYADWRDDIRKGVVSKEHTALGWTLYNNAANSGDTQMALDILQNMVDHQRNAAQALQATRILKTLSPETQLYNVQRSVANLQEELKKKYKDKAPTLKLDEELAADFLQAETEEARNAAEAALYKDIGRQMPSTFIDKWNAWRYLAMLGNARTHVRNIFGNAGFMPVVAAKNALATGLETAVDKATRGKAFSGERGARTKSLSAGTALYRAAFADYQQVVEQIMEGGKYQDFAQKKAIEDGRVIFKTKPLEWARRKNGAALELEDSWFAKPHYAAALASYCKANGITAAQVQSGKGLDKAREYAIREAQKATYRDTNDFSQWVSSIGRYSGDNKAGRAASKMLEGILPFRKTPANILARGVEYSPAGLLWNVGKGIYQGYQGTLNTAEFLDGISAGLTGTGLLALGFWLAAEGLARGAGAGDDEEKEFDKLMGHQDYSLELPDGTSVTLDWLAPEALPFFVGVNLHEQLSAKNGGERLNMADWLEAIGNVSEPMLEMSCLQSLNDLFDSVSYGKKDGSALGSVVVSSITSYLMQGLPTVFGQAERAGEGRRMTTYTEDSNWLTKDLQYTLGKASAKIPGLDFLQIPYIDAWGREELTGKPASRVANNFLNPAYTSKIDESGMEQELLRLYEQTGNKAVFPSRAEKSITVDKVEKKLTGEEYVKYATVQGQTAYGLVGKLVDSKAYRAMDDETKAECVALAYAYAEAYAKTQVSGYQPTGWQKKAFNTIQWTGMSPADYICAYEAQRGIVGLKDADGETIANSESLLKMEAVYSVPGLTDAQRKRLFQDFGVGKSVQHYNSAAVKEKLRRMR